MFVINRKESYMEIIQQVELFYSRTLEKYDNLFHFHDNYEVYIFLSGDVDFFIEQSCYSLTRGHLIVLNDKEIHRACYYGKFPCERQVLHVAPQVVRSLSGNQSNLLQCFQSRKSGTNNIVLLSEQQLDELTDTTEKLKNIMEVTQYGSDVLFNAYLAIFLTQINNVFRENQKVKSIPPNSLVSNILEFVNLSLGSDLSLETIAKHFSIDATICVICSKHKQALLYINTYC